MSNSYNSMAKKKLTIQLKIIKYLNKHFYKEDMHVTLTPVRMAITKRQETTTTEFIAIEKKRNHYVELVKVHWYSHHEKL